MALLTQLESGGLQARALHGGGWVSSEPLVQPWAARTQDKAAASFQTVAAGGWETRYTGSQAELGDVDALVQPKGRGHINARSIGLHYQGSLSSGIRTMT